MIVSKQRLSIIGKLIGIYREERRIANQSGYTIQDFCNEICSPNTLKKIENGDLSRSEEIYKALINRLDLDYGEFPVIDREVNVLLKQLYRSIEFYENEKIIDLSTKLIRILKEVSGYIYYSELLNIIADIKNYYQNDGVLNTMKKNRYKNLITKNCNVLADLLKLLLYASLSPECIIDFNKYELFVNDLRLFETELPCLKINLIHFYFAAGNYIKMNSLIAELENVFSIEGNNIRLLDMQNCKIALTAYNDRLELLKCIDKINEIISSENIPDIKLSECYTNIASAYHRNKYYKDALKYYEKARYKYEDNYLPNLIYMADCQNRLNYQIELPLLKNEDLENYSIGLRKMYKYFTLAPDVPEFVKQNYIMKEILPYLENDVNIDIFRYELNELVKSTGHYKDLLRFNKEVENNISIQI